MEDINFNFKNCLIFNTIIFLFIHNSFIICSRNVYAQQKPDFSIAPEVKSFTQNISSTFYQYQIKMPSDFTNYSIVISGEVKNPKILNDDTFDFYSLETMKQEILRRYALDSSDLQKALAVWRFKNDYFIEGAIPEINYYDSGVVNFFNVFGGGICGNSGSDGPQLAEVLGLNARTDHFDSDYLYSIVVNGRWMSFNNVSGDVYWLGRDNETIISNEELIEDHWLHRRVAKTLIHRVTGVEGDPNGIDMIKKELWWKAELPTNDKFGNFLNRQRKMSYSLKKYESIEMKWPKDYDYLLGDWATWYNYPYITANRTYDNEILYHPKLDDSNFLTDLYSYNNLEMGVFPKLHPSVTGKLATLIIKVEHPRLLLNASIGGTFYRKTKEDVNRIYVSLDNGSSWQLIWENDKTGESTHYQPFTITKIKLEGLTHSTEINSYLIKYEFLAAHSKSDAGLNDLRVLTSFELNSLTLPSLHPGLNQLKFTADAIGSVPVKILHKWNEERFSINKKIFTWSDYGVDVKLRIANKGTISAATKVRVYCGIRKRLGQMVAERSTGIIPAGGEITLSFQIPFSQIDNFRIYNAYVLTAIVDPDSTVDELDESNNYAYRPIRIFKKPEPLTIADFITYYTDEKKIKVVIWNRGDYPVENCLVRIYSGTEESGPDLLIKSVRLPRILRQEHYTIVINNIINRPPGIWVEIDPDNEIDEQFEHNNLIYSKGTQPPIVDVGPVRTVKVGEPIVLVASVHDPDGQSISSYKWEIDASSYSHLPVDSTLIKRTPTVVHTFNKEGDYMIRLTVVDAAGDSSKDTTLLLARTTTSVELANEIPKQYALYQNYPNPFNPTTNISFDLPIASHVVLKIFNVAGQEVSTLIDKNLPAGRHQISFNASNLATGIYFYKLKTKKFTAIKKMILVR